jgi:mRNA-degrading endonuclease RelE of RelBE toxin-antitoxin system
LYRDAYTEEITKKLAKLKKRDSKHYEIVRKKMDWILNNPEHNYKDLHYELKGFNRIHIGHFVLVFSINHIEKIVSFKDYDHHDNIYS